MSENRGGWLVPFFIGFVLGGLLIGGAAVAMMVRDAQGHYTAMQERDKFRANYEGALRRLAVAEKAIQEAKAKP